MNEYVLVEFIVDDTDRGLLIEKLREIDYELISSGFSGMPADWWYKIVAKIKSTDATAIKLQDPFLADRMRISYISSELKDRYRK
jgi:pyridoxal/pyridoxine/pyridoxamine kinase